MAPPNKDIFLQLWPKCFISFMAIIEVICVAILFITELGSVAANFWTTNVFAGGWCGLIMLIHLALLFFAGWCSPGPVPAYRAVFVSVIGLAATAALISFDATFITRPTTCILTPSCVTNAASNTTFSYSFRQSFFTVFNSWDPFKSYTESQVKFLCQSIQLGIGGLCFIQCLLYLIIYYVCANKAKQQVNPTPPSQQKGYYGPQQNYYAPPPLGQQGYSAPLLPAPPGYSAPLLPAPPGYSAPSLPPQQGFSALASVPSPPTSAALPPAQQGYYPPLPPQQYYQPPAPAWRPPPYVPQTQPGAIPWDATRGY